MRENKALVSISIEIPGLEIYRLVQMSHKKGFKNE